jgi:DNA-3-methyladenine glycosylase II
VDAGAPLTSRFSIDPAPPFRLDLTVWALRRRPTNIVDRWDGDTYRRAIHVGCSVAEVEVRQTGPPDAARLDVSATTAVPIEPAQAQAETAAAVRRLLGVDISLGEFYRRARLDPHLDPLAQRYRGLKPPRFPTIFECLVNAIACQQLTLTVGIVLLNRLAHTYGPTGPSVSGAAGRAFPDAADLASSTPAGLRQLGLSRRKAESILELARRVADGGLDLAGLSSLSDETVCASLQQLGGVGRWSAEYTLLRGLGRLAVFPGDDVGARNNLARRLHLDARLDYDSVGRAVAPWSPFAGLAYFHLLVERIDAAGWLGDVEGALTDTNRRRRP